jgi:lambda repressor-like predicted transcriptional regulator
MNNKLGDILKQRGITYQQLGQLVAQLRSGKGVSESTLVRIIKYGNKPAKRTQEAIAEALELHATEIWE